MGAVGRVLRKAIPGGEPLFAEKEPEAEGPELTTRDDFLSRTDRALLAVMEGVPEVPAAVGRGLSEVGYRTGIGVSELVGADKAAANLRAGRELSREVYGEPETAIGKTAEIGTQLVGEGASFLVPGAAAARGARAVSAAGRTGRALRFLSAPSGAAERAAQTFLTGAPIDLAISQAGPEDSFVGALGALTGDEELTDVSKDPVARGAFDVLAGFGLGEVLGEGLEAIGRARAKPRARNLGREAARTAENGVPRDDFMAALEQLPEDLRAEALSSFERELGAGGPRDVEPLPADPDNLARAVEEANERARSEVPADVLPETTPDYTNPQVAEAARRARQRGGRPISPEEAGVAPVSRETRPRIEVEGIAAEAERIVTQDLEQRARARAAEAERPAGERRAPGELVGGELEAMRRELGREPPPARASEGAKPPPPAVEGGRMPAPLDQIARRRQILETGSPVDRVPWSRRRVEPETTGKRQRTVFPGDDSKIETEYAVLEADDVRASHTADFTQRTPEEFPSEIQGRAYHGPRGRQAREHTEQIVSTFDPDRAFDPSITAAEGPPVITSSGINVAGNGRTIAMQRLYRADPARAEALLKNELVNRAEEFGLDPDVIRDMEQPILVRQIADESINQLDVQTLRRLNQASDVPSGKAKDVLSDAASRAEQLRSAEGALRHFAETIPEDATIRSYLEGKSGTEFLRRLVEDGVITRGERARFIDATTGSATQEGKQLVERMMYAAAIGDADVVARAPESVLRKLDSSLPALVRASRVEGFEVGEQLRKALDVLSSARATGTKLDDLLAQVDIERPPIEPAVAQMARFLETAPKAKIRDAFRGYAEDAEAFVRQSESDDLFGFQPKGPEDAGIRFAALAMRRTGRAERRSIARALRESQTEAFELRFSRDEPVIEAETPEEFMRRVEADPRAQVARERPQPGSGKDTWAVHGGENPTPERAAQRAEWRTTLEQNAGFADPAERLFQGEPARERKAVLILGPPAAGKSTVANEYLSSMRARLIDSDEVKKLMPEFEGGRGAGAVHEESSFIAANDLLEPALRRGDNIVRPTVGTDAAKIRRQVEALQRAGYEVHLVINELPALKAARRAWMRFASEERWVDPRYIFDVGDRPRAAFDAVKRDQGITSARRYSNDVPKGQDPELLEELGAVPEGLRGSRRDRGRLRRHGHGARGGRARVPRRLQETLHPLVDLFGEETGVARQAELLQERGPQGMTAGLDQARATVSSLEGKVARGAATAAERSRFEEARSLIRRAEGRGLDAGELARAREAEAPPTPDDNLEILPLAPQQQAGERLPAASPFYDRPEAISADVVSPQRIISELSEAIGKSMKGLGLKVAAGRFPKAVKALQGLGVFKSKETVIRQLDVGDVGVFGHEAGHAMHHLFFGTTPDGALRESDLLALPGAIRGELEDLGRDVSVGGVAEGWAETWRRYLDNPESLAREAPNTLRFIEERLEQFPEVREGWKLARDDWRAFRESSAQARIRSRISTGDRDVSSLSLEDRWLRFRTSVLDDLAPIQRVVDKIRENVGVDGIAEEAEQLARLTRGSVGVALEFIENGVIDFRTLRASGPGLKQIVAPVKGELDDFRTYMVARRAQELHGRDINTGFRAEDVDAAVTQLEAKNPKLKTAFEQLQTWNDGLLKYLRDSGVISAKSYDAIRELNQSYVPFQRVIEGGRTGGLGETYGHLFSPVKRIKGSGRDVIDPLESLVKNALTYTQIAQKQQVSKALAALADKPGVGKVLEELGTPIRRTQFRLGEIEGKLRDVVPGLDELLEDVRARAKEDFEAATAGMSKQEIRARGIEAYDPAEELLAVFRPGDYIGQPNVISVLEDGKRVFYEVDQELYAALEGLNKEQLDTWARWMGAPARTLRAGATLAPEFLIRNPLRDQVMAFIQSEYGYIPFVDMARGVFELARKGDAYHQWRAAGGYRAALTSLDRRSMQNAVRSMIDAGGVQNVIKHPIDALQALSALMEDATRMGEFLNARARPEGGGLLGRIRGGQTPDLSKEGLQRAAGAAREISVDFARHGARTATLRNISAFWNARLQGYDRMARAAKENPARFAAYAFSAITLPSLLEYFSNMDDPEYWEKPQWQRDLFWHVRVGDGFVVIPKPFELGLIFGTLPVRVLDSALGGPGGNHELREFLETSILKGEVSGIFPQPTALMPLLENTTNYSYFLRRPIVPRAEQEVRAEFQAGPGTSEVAQLLGRWAPGEGISPRKIDNLLFAYTGGLGRLGTEITDPLLEGRIPFTPGDIPPVGSGLMEFPGVRGVTDPLAGFSSESIERFYQLYEQARSATATLRFLERQESPDLQRELDNAEAAELRQREPELRAAADELASIRAEVEGIRRDPSMSSADKKTAIDQLGMDARAVAQQALGRELPGGGG